MNSIFGKSFVIGLTRRLSRTSLQVLECSGWRAYGYSELVTRDKASLDIFWLRDDALADSYNLPPPDVIAQETVDATRRLANFSTLISR